MIFLADTVCPHQFNVPLSVLNKREVEELKMKVQEGKKSFQNKIAQRLEEQAHSTSQILGVT